MVPADRISILGQKELPMTTQTQASLPVRRGADVMTLGFGTTVFMWALAYVSLMQPGRIVGEFLFGGILACAVAGGFLVARAAGRGALGGAAAGLVCGLLNLLLVGSIVAGDKPGEFASNAAAWAVGMVIVPVVLFAIGAAAGKATAPNSTDAARRANRNWPFAFVMVAAAATLLLITTGGLVTTLGAGLAVPDWPNSFGHNMLLFPLAQMDTTSGVYYEHAHRLYGMLVGVTGITLAVCMFIWDRRLAPRVLGIIVLLLICVQGYMGGMRVTEKSIALAIVHGFNGQVVLAMTVGLAMVLSSSWKNTKEPVRRDNAGLDRGLAIALLCVLVFQIVMGALYRHLQAVPEPSMPALMGLRHTHAFIGSMAVVVLVIIVSMRAVSANDGISPVKRSGKSMLHGVIMQVLLGVVAFLVVPTNPRPVTDPVPLAETIVATAHQVVGAALLANAFVYLLWVFKMLAKPKK